MKLLISINELKKLSKLMSSVISEATDPIYQWCIKDDESISVFVSVKNKLVANLTLPVKIENFEESYIAISVNTISTIIKTATLYNHENVLIEVKSPTKISYTTTSESNFLSLYENLTEENLYVPFTKEECDELTVFLQEDAQYSSSLEFTDELASYYEFIDKILSLASEDTSRGVIINRNILNFENGRHIVSKFTLDNDYNVEDFYLSRNMIKMLCSFKDSSSVSIKTDNSYWFTEADSGNFKIKSIYTYEKSCMPTEEEWSEMAPAESSSNTTEFIISKDELKNAFAVFSLHGNLYNLSEALRPISLKLSNTSIKFSWESFNETVTIDKTVETDGPDFDNLIIPSIVIEYLLKSIKEDTIKIKVTSNEVDEINGATILVSTDTCKALIVKCIK